MALKGLFFLAVAQRIIAEHREGVSASLPDASGPLREI
jgi:hypothetical protein